MQEWLNEFERIQWMLRTSGRLRQLHGLLIFYDRPLPVPSSFLIDRQGRLDVIYKGPVDVETLIADARPFAGDELAYAQRAAALPGRAIDHPVLNARVEHSRRLMRSRGMRW